MYNNNSFFSQYVVSLLVQFYNLMHLILCQEKTIERDSYKKTASMFLSSNHTHNKNILLPLSYVIKLFH